jgi:hypothetical protein
MSRRQRTRPSAPRGGEGRPPAGPVDARPRAVRGILWGMVLTLPLWAGIAAVLRLVAGVLR